MLLNSLLRDFSARAVLDRKSNDSIDYATDFQTNAAVRLLYCPDAAIPEVVSRLDGLEVGAMSESDKSGVSYAEFLMYGDWDRHNGVFTLDLVKSVAWCCDRRIVAALARIAVRSNDKEILAAIRH